MSLSELSAYFHGSRTDKDTVKLYIQQGVIEIIYLDGSATYIADPIQVQDLELGKDDGKDFMAYLRIQEPTAWRGMYFSRYFLELKLKLWRREKKSLAL